MVIRSSVSDSVDLSNLRMFLQYFKFPNPTKSPCKLSQQNFEYFTISGRLKNAKIAKQFPGLATTGRHNSAMITDRRKFTPNGPSTGCLFSTPGAEFFCLYFYFL